MSEAVKQSFEFVCLAYSVSIGYVTDDSPIERELHLTRGDTIWLTARQAQLRSDLIEAGALRQLVGRENIQGGTT